MRPSATLSIPIETFKLAKLVGRTAKTDQTVDLAEEREGAPDGLKVRGVIHEPSSYPSLCGSGSGCDDAVTADCGWTAATKQLKNVEVVQDKTFGGLITNIPSGPDAESLTYTVHLKVMSYQHLSQECVWLTYPVCVSETSSE